MYAERLNTHPHPFLPLEGEGTLIERDIQGCDGVVSVHFSKANAHMLEVAFDPKVIDTETLRKHVSERGLAVSKIGL